MSSLTDTTSPAQAYAESGFDDRVRNGCGLLIAMMTIAAWGIGGALLVNWLLPLGGAA